MNHQSPFSTKTNNKVSFLTKISLFIAFLVFTLEIAGISLIGYLIYHIYAYGLKSLIDSIWLGFSTVVVGI